MSKFPYPSGRKLRIQLGSPRTHATRASNLYNQERLRPVADPLKEIDPTSIPAVLYPPRRLAPLAFAPPEHKALGDGAVVLDSEDKLLNILRRLKYELPATGDKSAWFPEQIRLPCGELLSFGDVMALAGDHYSSADVLYTTKSEFLSASKWVMEHVSSNAMLLLGAIQPQQYFLTTRPEWKLIKFAVKAADALTDNKTLHKIDLLVNGDEDLTKAVKDFYFLALKNFDHFINDGHKNNPQNAKDKFLENMKSALKFARESHQRKEEDRAKELYNRAIFYAAYACHHLSDCFAAGHMRTPRLAVYNACCDIYKNKMMWWPLLGDIEQALVISGLYSMVAHHRDNRGLYCRSPYSIKELLRGELCPTRWALSAGQPNRPLDMENVFEARGDDHLHENNTTFVLCRLAVNAVKTAVFQMRWFGICDYEEDKKRLEDHPFSFIPDVAHDQSPEPLLSPINDGGGVTGPLWNDPELSQLRDRPYDLARMLFNMARKEA